MSLFEYVGPRQAVLKAARSALWIARPISYTTVSTIYNLGKLLFLAFSLVSLTAFFFLSMILYAIALLCVAPFGFTGGAIEKFAEIFERKIAGGSAE